jgi:hypothetical protein
MTQTAIRSPISINMQEGKVAFSFSLLMNWMFRWPESSSASLSHCYPLSPHFSSIVHLCHFSPPISSLLQIMDHFRACTTYFPYSFISLSRASTVIYNSR